MHRPNTNAQAIETTLAELKRMGRLEPVDTAQVQALRSMAAALDENPASAPLWRAYSEALERLRSDDSSGSVDELLDELSASVRDKA
jgi:hypothetical protein